MNLLKLSLLAGLSAASAAHAVTYIGENSAAVSTVIDLSSDPTGTWGGSYDSDTKTWVWDHATGVVMQNIVAIKNGTLVIPAGSVVRGQPRDVANTRFNPGTLLITRSAKLVAAGNAAEPIIFTTASTGPTGGRATGATPTFWDANPKTSPRDPLVAGLNGGVVILGNASTNVDRDGAGVQEFFVDVPGRGVIGDDLSSVEGIPDTAAVYLSGDDRFGGHNDNDNSGILTFASIRHGGANLTSNNELNGLTLGGVGSGTTINNIEIWGNTDDAVEIFGGTVNLTNVAIFAPQDDGLDLDVGYRGTVQNLLVVAANNTDKMAEWDGSYENEGVNGFSITGPVTSTFTPYSMFAVVNATFVGNKGAGDFSHGLHIRDQAGVRLINSIVVNASRNTAGTAGSIEIDNRSGVGAVRSTTNNFVTGRSFFKGVTFQGAFSTVADWVHAGSADATIEGILGQAVHQNIFNGSVGFVNVPTGGTLPANLRFDPRPQADADPVFEEAVLGSSGNYVQQSYRGAFDPGAANLWTADWTAADTFGLIVK